VHVPGWNFLLVLVSLFQLEAKVAVSAEHVFWNSCVSGLGFDKTQSESKYDLKTN
jgi:hypothetical protein